MLPAVTSMALFVVAPEAAMDIPVLVFVVPVLVTEIAKP